MQKEKLSALMDGENIDNEVIWSLSQDRTLQQSWHRYHLIRDTLRGDISEVVHLDIADKVSAALALEPAITTTAQPAVSQPHPESWKKMPFWHKVRPWFSQVGQIGIAAGVSLAVIVGVQQYNQQGIESTPDTPVFNTIPLGGQASPVSFDVATEGAQNTNQQALEQRKRINAMLQDYELQRRLHAEQLKIAPQASTSAKTNGSTQTGLTQ
ncbi:anti-sigma-E factor RseA [Pragia fontium]|uniref:Anti-sigma-E factor RseA n=2 Tax=Pragia fontium TaxID=82985 RepID=A0AAJ4W7B1_9GAMM|nr:anti-sigma-E factor RseA [Pragia fontium]AKJ41577.1 anti-RNA polymerase sigma factor SigE [Pragia fontium]SFB95241.1 sigma-E factor negative regulatory protein RseA [Pragia fontium DSM 5563 = ATCC 49100]SUB81795.1 Sigma-E factor negative regulatory protein [Pragia fontium]VEJ54343.1 Sigma-E factor negative regulatory protein [Pragia fontium]GKX63094.1 anti-sigma-E factor RseA [Pragia fontium]